jgi:CheY-like chemotaxis protein
MNLVINASEAIGDTSGVIAVSTGQIQCDRRYLKDAWLNDSMEEGLYVSIEVSDTGCGMDKDTLEKIFDPFFTTKFTGRGLGMAAVLGIVRGHKGAIRVYSESGKGTSFKILLPASEKVVINSENETDQCGGAARGTVLLVDDEDTLRDIGTEMLKELGYDVVTANDGRDALAVYSANKDIDLVILDLTMPHLDGEACFRELRLIKPDVKVIISSGFSEQEVTQKFAGRGLAGFIQKPYRLSVLKEAIRAVHP